MSIVIGLTGGIATGKSTVSQMFKNIGIPVIDADVIGKEIVEINKPAYHKIIETFGDEVRLCTGHINRRKLGVIVFNDEEKREQLSDIIHPEVRKVMEEEIKKLSILGHEIIVIDVPLLFESHYGFTDLCDVKLVVFTDEATQIERLMNRDKITKEEAIKRIKSQMDVRMKLQKADFKIDNSLSVLETRKQFDSFMKKIKEQVYELSH